ncbi:hypothetical protein PsYK624_107190 [Phanerochaete sordida]|uniref:Uncharacterized protein n=1 Tax=Phanerochaete sordida TaxID=48140 RepID=A0A9P3GJ74_9APHY|nr:hypothetical protein PsYK624_107190 [Phanerochaete sordida]
MQSALAPLIFVPQTVLRIMLRLSRRPLLSLDTRPGHLPYPVRNVVPVRISYTVFRSVAVCGSRKPSACCDQSRGDRVGARGFAVRWMFVSNPDLC